ncbi:D-alanine--D-alanine ligase [uncultured Desulfuromusa sp.]|uniref:D-alanine--D-alanine ligase n=1 Tax=uncultured Desulfuromusa sp. TaxID=219183 RepID=UPI002AA86F32|nr:D-alanine--D-alanine ligase [uncultured Desulfuromusa sp.]
MLTREEMKTKKIGVLLGGLSAEREVSLKTGNASLRALQQLGYDAVAIDVKTTLSQQLLEAGIEVAFIALHGRFGEDGRVQGLLELMHIPYTGSGVMSSSMAIDKVMTKQLLCYHQLPTPRFDFMGPGDSARDLALRCKHLPLVVKPSREGSTIGITIAKNHDDLVSGIHKAAALDGTVLVEEYIEGVELTVSVLNGEVCPVIQIVPKSGFYDYQSKYTTGATEYLIPAPIAADTYKQVQEAALRACDVLGCRGAARVDFMCREKDFYCIEVNTIPGMTETSLLPQAAKAAGIDFPQLVEMILLDADMDK